MFGERHIGGPHQDLLDADPATDESRVALVEEIKNRARGIFAAGNFPEAQLLYDKAIKVKPDAILYANRSAVRLNLNSKDSALEDAKKAIELDPSYSKAYYRKGQAHNACQEYQLALESFVKGMELDPKNRTFKDMAIKAKEMIEAQAKAAAEASSGDAMAVDTTTTNTTTTAAAVQEATKEKPKAPPRKKKESSSSSSSSSAAKDVTEEDVEELKAENLRGYKTLADGRKTTYFNNVLSEDAKKLIGDIAPKKIEVQKIAAVAPEQKQGAGSAWNYAGTFEERNMTDWAKARLNELLYSVNFVIPSVGSVIDVVKIKDLEGDAAVTFVRGKKKYLFDFVFTLEWEAELECGKAKGTLKYPDVTPDNDDEYDTLLEVDQLTPPEARYFINTYVKSSSDGIQKVVTEKLKEFMKEFQTF